MNREQLESNIVFDSDKIVMEELKWTRKIRISELMNPSKFTVTRQLSSRKVITFSRTFAPHSSQHIGCVSHIIQHMVHHRRKLEVQNDLCYPESSLLCKFIGAK